MADIKKLRGTADALLSRGKGILAADQSPHTMNKQLASIGVPQEAEMRRKYRQLLFTAPGIEQYLTGVILHDGMIRNHTDEGLLFSDLLISKGIIPIIKVDKGTVPHPNFPGEVLTEGLDGLERRLEEYYDIGARAAKWRAVITIGSSIPTMENIRADAFSLARYGALCQEVGILPILEPEVLFTGDHDIKRAEAVTTLTLQTVFDALLEQRVDPRGVVLKSSMVLAGSEYKEQSSPREVAEATLRTFKHSVPEDVPGVVFLSGGQTPERATVNLDAIAEYAKDRNDLPWRFAFSYSRGIEEPVQRAWLGRDENIPAAQEALLTRLKLNSLAELGTYEPSMEK